VTPPSRRTRPTSAAGSRWEVKAQREAEVQSFTQANAGALLAEVLPVAIAEHDAFRELIEQATEAWEAHMRTAFNAVDHLLAINAEPRVRPSDIVDGICGT
jgi:hypothetical protein